jgi:hypothetical protein
VKTIDLRNVVIQETGGHGVLINDQTFPEEAGDPDAEPDPIPPTPDGSDASVVVAIIGSRFQKNGFGAGDRDGVRVNEGGAGDLIATVTGSVVDRNGGDGIELDERGGGNAEFEISDVQLTRNGKQDPEDLDDGLDVDESLDGDVLGTVSRSAANDNYEEGWDLNENDAGNFVVDMTAVEANRNGEEGVDFEEDDDFAGGGDLTTELDRVAANGNAGGDAGLKIREKGDGNLASLVGDATADGNDTDGINIREDSTGNLGATVDHSTADRNTGDGIHFDERSGGSLNATASDGSASRNLMVGVRAQQGTGTLLLDAMVLLGNHEGPFFADQNVVVTVTP